MSELPYWQPLSHGSAEGYASWNRRNRFGHVKNDACQDLTRGRIRVMGLARVIMALFLAMAANLRLTQTFQRRQNEIVAAAAAGEDADPPPGAVPPAAAPEAPRAPRRAPAPRRGRRRARRRPAGAARARRPPAT